MVRNIELESESLSKLIKLLNEYKHFKYPNDPKFLMAFLCVRKYDVNAAAQSIFNCFKYRDLYLNGKMLLPKDYVDLIRYDYGGLLKNCDPSGKPVYVHKCVWNIKDGHVFDDLWIHLYFAIFEIYKRVDVQSEGLVIVLDYSGLRWVHVKEVGITRTRNLLGFQHSMPIKLKEVHVVNNPIVYNPVFSIAKPFLKDKLKRRIHIHGEDLSSSSFYEALPKNILPKSLGGYLTNEEAYNFTVKQNILKNTKEFEEIAESGYRKKRHDHIAGAEE